METLTQPTQSPVQSVTGNWMALQSTFPVPGLGVLPVNAFLLKDSEPLLVDTGLSALSDDFIDALASEIALTDLRWIWLSHTDPDHIGNLDRILDLAPNAQVVTNFLGAGKMGLLGTGSPDRFRLLEPGEVFEAGGRRLHQVRPPYYDAPETMGFFDETDRVLFAADAFGALLPEPATSIEQIAATDLREGLVGWSTIDAPWLAQMDQATLAGILKELERLDPRHVLSGHLPVAHGIQSLTDILRTAYGRGSSSAVNADHAAEVEAVLNAR
ncbi:MBL fold metallo-hydrolase [Roseibium aggregatum]|uniref:MBL fold metallo-hydrolase n=1 Tax=Roseibium aggregatum TaxID=187304 RepID=A0A926P055_9HYPH|nr:MBL fold metallo-hydrolase [Roseibium aggregatum]MBD1547501.1 MBL fold metallo-hydrolase [Roseibium aggregatum]